ncbi:sialidase family protein [Membranihabitans marinus]|uniref:sialidase family protein n=1 Tax=Membranihabitans marinus TaxID=1227546 RepID=UPI001F36A013|nr:sialidase family protein [Membranihabitans marinus]
MKTNYQSNIRLTIRVNSILFFSLIFVCNLFSQGSKVPGVVVDYIPASLQYFVGSPSICVLEDGSYIASHDRFGPESNYRVAGTTEVFKSTNKGKTWNKISTIVGQHWSNLFTHNNELYLLGTSKAHGNIVIRRSIDGGVTWSTPNDKTTGLLFEGIYHTAPMPIIKHDGRLWRTMEKAEAEITSKGKKYPQKLISAFMMSVSENVDLLNAENWVLSNALPHNSTYLDGNFGGWIEGNAIVTKSGDVVNMLRVGNPNNVPERAALIRISKDGKKASFDPESDFIHFSGGAKKFTVRYDSETDEYWSLVNYVKKEFSHRLPGNVRNTLVLVSSPDLKDWTIRKVILEHPDVTKHGFQYVDWQFEGKDIILVSRTAYDDKFGGSHSHHDANYLTFHRIKKYKKLLRSNLKID